MEHEEEYFYDPTPEEELVGIAEQAYNDEVAKVAIIELKKNYSKNYTYCLDCDGMVVKEKCGKNCKAYE